jgi:predicted aspartyl protease
MKEKPFTINVRINKNKFLRALVDFGCLYYATISKKHATRLNLPRINIPSRIMEEFEGKNMTTIITSIIYANVNINGYERRLYFYEIPYQNYDIIFGRL